MLIIQFYFTYFLKRWKVLNLLSPSLVAGSKKLVLLVENVGEITLKVNLTIGSQSANQQLEVPKYQTKKVWILLCQFLILCFIISLIDVVIFSDFLGILMVHVSFEIRFHLKGLIGLWAIAIRNISFLSFPLTILNKALLNERLDWIFMAPKSLIMRNLFLSFDLFSLIYG